MTVGTSSVGTSGALTNGSNTQFNFSFPVAAYGGESVGEQLDVKLVLLSTGAETTLSYPSDFSVSANADQEASPGGSITTTATYATGYKIYIRLAPVFEQSTDLTPQGPFTAETHENQFDHFQRQLNVLRDRIRRAPRAGVQASSSFDGEIAGAVTPGHTLIINPNGDGWVLTAPTSSDTFAEIVVNDYLSGSNWGAAFNDAIGALPTAGGIIRLLPGSDVSLGDEQVVCTGNNVVFDFRGSKIRPRYTGGSAFKFGTGAAQVQQYTVLGGWFLYDAKASGGPEQALFELRGVRAFRTIGCVGSNIYQLAIWGNPADDETSYKWWNVNCEWNGRTNANGGHTDFIQCDGSEGGYYHYGTDIEGDSENIAAEAVFMRLTSSQGPARFDHAEFGSGIVKGFDHLIKAVDARIVNIEQSGNFRCDDTQSYGIRVDVSSGATKGGCEDVNLHGSYAGLGPGGIIYVSNASASIDCEDIHLKGCVSNNATGPVARFTTSGSGDITNIHIDGLHVADYDPADAAQDVIIFDGDIDESSVDHVHVDGRSGATYLARRVVYDNTAATKKIHVGEHISGDVNTALVTRTNAGHLTGRYNLVPRSAAVNYEAPRVIIHSGAAIAHTGTTAETTLATVTIPAGAMGANGRVRIDSFWSGTNSGNNKTMRHKFGGTNYFAQNMTTNQSWHQLTEIWNTGATNSQKGSNNNSWASGGAALNSSSVDTTSAVSILLTGQLATDSETLTLESYRVELIYGA